MVYIPSLVGGTYVWLPYYERGIRVMYSEVMIYNIPDSSCGQ